MLWKVWRQKKVAEFHVEDDSKFFVGKVDKVQTNVSYKEV